MGSVCTNIHAVHPSGAFNVLSPPTLKAPRGAQPASAEESGGRAVLSSGSSVGEDGSSGTPKTRESQTREEGPSCAELAERPSIPGSAFTAKTPPERSDDEQESASKAAWKLLHLIGRGSFGEVYLAQDDAGQKAAVKVLGYKAEESNFSRRVQLLERELTILKRLPAHPNIVKYLTARCRGSRVFIFMEYCDGGSLRELYLRRQRAGLMLCEGQKFTCSVLLGLRHLHSHGIAHRDVKCENVFLTKEGDAKLGDFGASIVLEDSLRSSFIGSIHWMAPEVVRREGHTWQADIWSLGCTVMEMFSGTHPFQQFPTVKGVVAFLSSDDPVLFDPTRIPRAACDFILACLKRSPSARPDTDSLLGHQFLASDGEVTPFNLSFQSNFGALSPRLPLHVASAPLIPDRALNPCYP